MLPLFVMKNEGAQPPVFASSTARVEKVREAVEKMVSSEDAGASPAGNDPAEVAAQKRLGEIERHVGELVGDASVEKDGRAREGDPET